MWVREVLFKLLGLDARGDVNVNDDEEVTANRLQVGALRCADPMLHIRHVKIRTCYMYSKFGRNHKILYEASDRTVAIIAF